MESINRRQLYVLIATVLGTAVAFLDGTIVNLALPRIGTDLHANFAALQWIVDGYLLSLSALILLGGSLGDIFGRKRVYLVGLIGFGVSSLMCALAPNAPLLIGLRVGQGVFGALLTPGALAIINTNFPKDLRSQAIGRWTSFGSVAIVLGPLAGGLILAIASWRWIFLINIPIIVACIAFALPSIEESRDSRTRRVDLPGALTAAAALAGITYGLIQGPASHWRIDSLAALVLGTALTVYFVRIERQSKDPMVELGLFKSRNFSGANLMTFAMYGALSGFTFALIIYLQTKMGYSSLAAGFSLLPVSVLMFFLAGRVGKLAGRFGPRLFMTAGPITSALGIASLYSLTAGDSYWLHILPGAVLFGVGLVLTVAPLTITVMSSVEEASSGIASGVNNAVARVAGLLVIAVLGILGTNHVYQFAIAVSAGLALLSGVLSFVVIRNIVPSANE
ncbi:MAG: MFS transporter [Candidatus Saccharibacteria bacterium]